MTASERITRGGFLLAIVTALLFGTGPNAARGIYAEGGNVTFGLLITIWARALTMAAFCKLTQRKLFADKTTRRQGIIGGLYQAVSVLCLYIALLYLSAPVAMIILFTHTLMMFLYMVWRGERKLDKATLATTLIALAGLTLVLDLWQTQPAGTWVGYLCATITAVTTASRLYIFGRQMRTHHPIVVGAENFLVAAAALTLVAFVVPPVMPVTSLGWIYVALSAVTVSIASFGLFYGIGMMGSFQWSLLLKIEPIFTSLFAVLMLGETLRASQYAGIVVVIGSLAVYQIAMHRRQTKELKPQG